MEVPVQQISEEFKKIREAVVDSDEEMRRDVGCCI